MSKELTFAEQTQNDLFNPKKPSDGDQDDFMKSQQTVQEAGIHGQQKIYFEEFYVHDLRVKFSFKSSPIMFRELALHPTLKFVIVLLSNLKKVKLHFASFSLRPQQQLMSIFLA